VRHLHINGTAATQMTSIHRRLLTT